MKKIKIFFLVCLTLLTALFSTGCGSDKDSDKEVLNLYSWADIYEGI